MQCAAARATPAGPGGGVSRCGIGTGLTTAVMRERLGVPTTGREPGAGRAPGKAPQRAFPCCGAAVRYTTPTSPKVAKSPDHCAKFSEIGLAADLVIRVVHPERPFKRFAQRRVRICIEGSWTLQSRIGYGFMPEHSKGRNEMERIQRTISVRHVSISIAKTFSDTCSRFESRMGRIDHAAFTKLLSEGAS